MNINIYKPYSFSFDAGEYIRNFKESLCKAGIKKPADFNNLLKNTGIKSYDYETIKSYFYGRRVPPLDVFIAAYQYCKSKDPLIYADDIVFPHSVQDPAYSNDIRESEDLFRSIFYPYNPPEEGDTPDDLTEFFDAESYECNIDALALILSRYNYLIQKYHYAAVSDDELKQIMHFTEKYIIDRTTDGITDAEEVTKWIRACGDEAFIEAFYKRYTLGFYAMSCHRLLEILRTAIDAKFISYAEQLLPDQDKFAR